MDVWVSGRFEEGTRGASVGAEKGWCWNPGHLDGLSQWCFVLFWLSQWCFVLLLSPKVAEYLLPPSCPPLLPSWRATTNAE